MSRTAAIEDVLFVGPAHECYNCRDDLRPQMIRPDGTFTQAIAHNVRTRVGNLMRVCEECYFEWRETGCLPQVGLPF